ncbi:zinc finger protein 599 [Stylonychia lemnae]|uniref:Zinc finger protein 599 n=1 Tax=Stylonychia lemnae TaxID=5949 RepID=A0A078B387_STYLE|nr:zinc finger protein 599 [Stylonychia lemnae]|eukprot:CDW88731.1 zinc finger protein 599 [Stylonychia lemnae]
MQQSFQYFNYNPQPIQQSIWAPLPSMNQVIQGLLAVHQMRNQVFQNSLCSTASNSPMLSFQGVNTCSNMQQPPLARQISPQVLFSSNNQSQASTDSGNELDQMLHSLTQIQDSINEKTRENTPTKDSLISTTETTKGDYYQKVSTIKELNNKFKDIPEDLSVHIQTGRSFDLNSVRIKKHVPSTQNYRIFTFKNPKSKRLVKILQCDECGKQFRKWHNFFDHLRIHTNERPYVCAEPGCNFSFTQKANLNKHIEVHTGIKRFQCEICNKSFFTNFNLKSHSKTHKRSEKKMLHQKKD